MTRSHLLEKAMIGTENEAASKMFVDELAPCSYSASTSSRTRYFICLRINSRRRLIKSLRMRTRNDAPWNIFKEVHYSSHEPPTNHFARPPIALRLPPAPFSSSQSPRFSVLQTVGKHVKSEGVLERMTINDKCFCIVRIKGRGFFFL